MEIGVMSAFKTTDGRIFADKIEANNHQRKLNQIIVFNIMVENSFKGYLVIYARDKHKGFAQYWCETKYGNSIKFRDDVHSSIHMVELWRMEPTVDTLEYIFDHPEKILDRIVEVGIEKITWPDDEDA